MNTEQEKSAYFNTGTYEHCVLYMPSQKTILTIHPLSYMILENLHIDMS